MTRKTPVSPDRIRTVPEQFSWVDHRLVRDRYIERLTHKSCALYLFLVTVADSQGLSYYSDPSLCERLAMNEASLDSARSELRQVGLVAYRRPIYQVLPLGEATAAKRVAGPPMAIGEIFKRLAGGVR
ncbi:MAG: hypothetical protein HGA50_09590 [Deltaproteobacteria bacterium]|nr:hypothetical protein [Deltaproteobacteria bacterium]NTW67462.1 hypothetical protein [Nitrospirota bacterium]